MKNITDEKLTADRLRLGELISAAYKADQDANPGTETLKVADVVERLFNALDSAEYADLLRVALFDSVDDYFTPSLSQFPPELTELFGQLGIG